jgi:hypothetical protein
MRAWSLLLFPAAFAVVVALAATGVWGGAR